MRVILLFTFLIFAIPRTNSQTNSDLRIHILAYTAKVWGFCKYYHPGVRAGLYDWDQALFNILPVVDTTTSLASFNRSLMVCLNSIDGDLNRTPSIPDSSHKEELDWILNKKIFSQEVSDKLLSIELKKKSGWGYYAKIQDGFRSDFSNEKEIHDFDVTNKDHRFLELFRFWNCVEYFSPYKNLALAPWDSVLIRMISKYDQFSDAVSQQLNTLELISATNDGHAAYIPKLLKTQFGFKLAPMRIIRIENDIVVSEFNNQERAMKDDIRLGDIITKISGTPIDTIIQRVWKYIPASCPAVKYRDSQFFFLNSPRDSLLIEFKRGDEVFQKFVSTYSVSDSAFFDTIRKPMWQSLNEKVGYINLGKITRRGVKNAFCELYKKKGIIIDARRYPKSTFVEIAKHLLETNTKILRLQAPKLDYPGSFYYLDYTFLEPVAESCRFTGKLVLIVDEYTQSQGEWVAMTCQQYENTTVIGTHTAGANGYMSTILLPNGDLTAISGIGKYYLNGTITQGKGVRIDHEVHRSIKGLSEGRDEQLEFAIQLIENS